MDRHTGARLLRPIVEFGESIWYMPSVLETTAGYGYKANSTPDVRFQDEIWLGMD